MIIAGYAMGREARLQLHPRRNLRGLRAVRACARRRAPPASCWGENILGSGFTFDPFAHHGYGAYICGEETALLESLEGKGPAALQAAVPGLVWSVRQADHHQQHRIRSVPHHPRRRPEIPEAGKPNNGGTKLFSVSGHVNNRPGNYEIRWAPVLGAAGNGRRHENGKSSEAVIRAARRCRCCRATS